jgi:hypothetical protein
MSEYLEIRVARCADCTAYGANRRGEAKREFKQCEPNAPLQLVAPESPE